MTSMAPDENLASILAAAAEKGGGKVEWYPEKIIVQAGASAFHNLIVTETIRQIPAETPISRAMSKELAQRGFKFCGPTIVYAFMQAVGMVNDHLTACHRHDAVQKLARKTA